MELNICLNSMDNDYSKREIDHLVADIRETLVRMEAENIKSHSKLEANQKYTNGTVMWHTKVLLVVGTVTITLLVVNGSELLDILKILI